MKRERDRKIRERSLWDYFIFIITLGKFSLPISHYIFMHIEEG